MGYSVAVSSPASRTKPEGKRARNRRERTEALVSAGLELFDGYQDGALSVSSGGLVWGADVEDACAILLCQRESFWAGHVPPEAALLDHLCV